MTRPTSGNSPWDRPPTPARAWAHRIAALAAVGLVVTSYTRAALDGTPAKGHPWLAAAALSLAAFFLAQNRLWRGEPWVRIAAVLLPLAAVGSGVAMLLDRG